MSDDRKDEDYAQGVHDGQHDDGMQRVMGSFSKGFQSEEYRTGYEYGETHPPSEDSSDSSSSDSSSDSSSCFITTATLVSIGKPDNCDELNVFRSFRDNWLVKQLDGQELISEYYKIAPSIVNSINSVADNKNIYRELWTESIEPCLNLIKQNRFAEAKTIYCNAVANLRQEFLDK
jgi:hypothetical protein